MAHGQVSQSFSASSVEVFDLLHDYDRRLEWDTLLSAAYLDDGHRRAEVGAASVCVGRGILRPFALKTVYVTFERGKVAAVRMVNSPPLFETWAASIRHTDLGPGRSRVTYTFQFTVRSRAFRWLLEPILRLAFHLETRKRLRALARHFDHA